MASGKDIRRRIKGVRSTGKITRAMEMISAVKMRRAVEAVLAVRPYAVSVIQVLHQLAHSLSQGAHPLLSDRPIRKEIYVVITSNRGLCGAFNAQVMRRVRAVLREDVKRTPVFVTIGRRGEQVLRRMNATILASFPDILTTPSTIAMRPISRLLMDEFLAGRADRVVMIYTDYVSALSQIVKVRALLPVTEKDTRKALHEMNGVSAEPILAEYTIEPSPERVLEHMIPRLVEMELYHALLESNASQESARMVAMKNATEAAQDMAADLTLAYNQLRQQRITQEIAELSAGMAAVSR